MSISGRVGQNVRVAAGQVTLSGDIGRNVTVVGGSVELTRGASVKGSLVAAGGNVHIAAPIGKIARIAAGVSSSRAGAARALDAVVGALTLTLKAEVHGDARYVSRREASVDSGGDCREPFPGSCWGRGLTCRSEETPWCTLVALPALP